MRKLITLAIIVALAVLLVLGAKGNTGSVAIFLDKIRIDFSLNFAIVAVFLSVLLAWLILGAVRASGRLPVAVRHFFMSRKERQLELASTNASLALVLGDESLSEKAFNAAEKTGRAGDLAYVLRALSALEAGRLDKVDEVLALEGVSKAEHQDVITLIKARAALMKRDFEAAHQLLQSLPDRYLRFPRVVAVTIETLIGLGKWSEALALVRRSSAVSWAPKHQVSRILGLIYQGLVESSDQTIQAMEGLVQSATGEELEQTPVLSNLATGLASVGAVDKARILLEPRLDRFYSSELLTVYEKVALMTSSASLPFVERLLEKRPGDLALLNLAAQVCEEEQLWGKAIARFESIYMESPSPSVAGRLYRLYDLAGQPEKAKYWRESLNRSLGIPSQVS